MRNKILNELKYNSRLSTEDLAALIGEDSKKVAEEIDKMEDENVICGYHTMIDWEKVEGERADALIEVKVTPQRGVGFDEIAERIYQYPEVSSIYLISGSFDFAVFIEGKSMREVAMFVTEKLSVIDGVLSTATQFVLKKYKEDGVVMASTKKDERVEIA